MEKDTDSLMARMSANTNPARETFDAMANDLSLNVGCNLYLVLFFARLCYDAQRGPDITTRSKPFDVLTTVQWLRSFIGLIFMVR